MKLFFSFLLISKLALVAFFTLSILSLVEEKIVAQTPSVTEEITTNTNNELIFIPRAKKGSEQGPSSQSATGSYGEDRCPQSIPNLTALVPGEGLASQDNNQVAEDKTLWSITAQESPTFWFYIPYPAKGELEAEFLVMTNESQEVAHNGIYKIDKTPGIVSIILQDKPLVVGKNYYWSLTIICDPENRDSDVYVEGNLRRVNATPQLTPIPTAKPEEKVILYAQDGLWNETITTILQELYPLDSELAKLYLRDLLKSEYVGLESLAEQSIISCCVGKAHRRYH